MIKKLPICLALLWAAPALAQGFHYQGIALGPLGHPVSTATITVCAAGATGAPCSPTVPIFSDPALLAPKANPFTSDGIGNFDFYAAPGNYVYTITGDEIAAGQTYAITIPCVPNSAASGCGSGSVSGVNDSIQSNVNGQLYGDGNLLWNPASQILSVLGKVGVSQTAPQFALDVAGAAAFNQFENAYIVADRMPGADMCAKIANAWAALAAINPLGGIADARGFTGTQNCGGSMWANDPGGNFNATLLTGNVNIVTAVTQIRPSNSNWISVASHGVTVPYTNGGTSLQPSNTFPANTPIEQWGSTADVFGVQDHNIRISCLPPNGSPITGSTGVLNQWAEEGSTLDNVWLDGCMNAGLEISSSQAQNSGPYNISANLDGVTNAGAVAVRIGNAATSAMYPLRKISGTINGGGANGVEASVGVAVDFASGIDLSDVHCEQFVTCIEVGANHPTHSVRLENVQCSGSSSKPVATCVDISSANVSDDIVAENIFAAAGQNVTSVLADHLTNGGTIPVSAEQALGLYVRGPSNQILTTSGQISDQIGLPVLGSFTVTGLPTPSSVATGALAVVTDAATAGNCASGGGSGLALCRNNGSAWTALGDGGSGGGGNMNNPMTVAGDMIAASASGSPATAARIAGNTSNVPQILESIGTGTAAQPPQFLFPGIPVNAQTASSYTIAPTDRGQLLAFSSSAPVAVTLPQAGSSVSPATFSSIPATLAPAR